MSNTIRIYKDKEGRELHETAYVGEASLSGRANVQLSIINGDSVGLSGRQTRDLINVLTSRMNGEPGFGATDSIEPEVIEY